MCINLSRVAIPSIVIVFLDVSLNVRACSVDDGPDLWTQLLTAGECLSYKAVFLPRDTGGAWRKEAETKN